MSLAVSARISTGERKNTLYGEQHNLWSISLKYPLSPVATGQPRGDTIGHVPTDTWCCLHVHVLTTDWFFQGILVTSGVARGGRPLRAKRSPSFFGSLGGEHHFCRFFLGTGKIFHIDGREERQTQRSHRAAKALDTPLLVTDYYHPFPGYKISFQNSVWLHP